MALSKMVAHEMGTTLRVGDVFEGLTKNIITGCEECERFDLCIPSMSVGVEVKACDNNHSFRVATRQMKGHGNLASGFPFDHCLYFFFGYANPRVKDGRGRSVTALKLVARKKAANAGDAFRKFLLEKINVIYVVDIKVLECLYRDVDSIVSDRSIPGQLGEVTIDLNRGLLHQICNGGRHNLLQGSDDLSHLITRGTMSIKEIGLDLGRINEVPLVSVLPAGINNEFLERLSGFKAEEFEGF